MSLGALRFAAEFAHVEGGDDFKVGVKDGVLDIDTVSIEFGGVPLESIEDVIDKFGVARDL